VHCLIFDHKIPEDRASGPYKTSSCVWSDPKETQGIYVQDAELPEGVQGKYAYLDGTLNLYRALQRLGEDRFEVVMLLITTGHMPLLWTDSGFEYWPTIFDCLRQITMVWNWLPMEQQGGTSHEALFLVDTSKPIVHPSFDQRISDCEHILDDLRHQEIDSLMSHVSVGAGYRMSK
jgi:hypothetical protein